MERVAILLRARLAGDSRGTSLPFAAILSQILIAGFVSLLLRDDLPPFAYALCLLILSAALVAIPLLGDLGYLLRADEASEWVRGLPVRERELHLARTAHLLIAVGVLASGTLVPAALLAPAEMGVGARLAFVGLGLGQVVTVAALLLLVQAVLAGRLEGLFVLFQTLLVMGVVLGLAFGLRRVQDLKGLEAAAGPLWLIPSSWFAAPLGSAGPVAGLMALAIALAALAVLFLTPAPGAAPPRDGRSSLEWFLLPARRLAQRVWVRADERAAFDWVYDALPREREVVLRTYPMIGIPFAFLVAGAALDGPKRESLLALLLFAPGIYLPILLAHLPASASHAARWLVEVSPARPGAVASGATKALFVRFLFPLHAILFVLAWIGGSPQLALTLALPGALVSTVVLKLAYQACVADTPLSLPPDEALGNSGLSSSLMLLAFFLPIAAMLAWSLVRKEPLAALGFTAALLLLDWLAGRRLRRLTRFA